MKIKYCIRYFCMIIIWICDPEIKAFKGQIIKRYFYEYINV